MAKFVCSHSEMETSGSTVPALPKDEIFIFFEGFEGLGPVPKPSPGLELEFPVKIGDLDAYLPT